MAGTGEFEVTFTARGGQAAMPHLTGDPILAGGHFVTGVQQIAARAIDPLSASVVTIGSFQGGIAQNIIPTKTVLTGTFRAFSLDTLKLIQRRLEEIVGSAAAIAGAQGSIRFDDGLCPPVVNTRAEGKLIRDVAADLFGESELESLPPTMAGDDFGVFLQHLPGAYIWIGNGETGEGAGLHQPGYDFNDDILVRGASLLAATAERALA